MSSSDPTSTETHASADQRSPEEAAESLDASLDAIMMEAREEATPVAQLQRAQDEKAAQPTKTVAADVVTAELELPITLEAVRPAAEVSSDGVPMPIDDPPPDRSDAPGPIEPPTTAPEALVGAAAAEEPWAAAPLAGSPQAASDDPPTAEEIGEAEVLVETVVAEEPEQAAASEEAAPSEDEALLERIVLPGAVRPTPSVGVPTLGGGALLTEETDEDRTAISPMPLEAEMAAAKTPTPAYASPLARRTTPWQVPTDLVDPMRPPLGRLPEPPGRGPLESVRKLAGRRVSASVGQMVMLVLAGSLVGGGAVHLLGAAPAGGAVRTSAPHVDLETAPPPRSPDIAPLPAPAAAAEEPTPEPAKPRPTATHAQKHVAAHGAAAEPTERAGDATAEGTARAGAPLKKTAAANKPRTRKVAQQTNWVDPFGD